MKRKTHWLDEVAQELHEELRSSLNFAKLELKGDVPLGTVEATEEEQLGQFLQLSPEALDELSATLGPQEVEKYVMDMTKLAHKTLGPFAPFVLQRFEDQPAQVPPMEEPMEQPLYNNSEI